MIPHASHTLDRRTLGLELAGFLQECGDDVLLLHLADEFAFAIDAALARAAGWGKVSMADAEALLATLGVTPGSVTPFGLVNAQPGEVRVVLDAALAESEGLVWFHPLVNTASTGVHPADLLRFLRGLGHEVVVLRLADPGPD